jgi:hypothetical protein
MTSTVWIVWKPRRVELDDSRVESGVDARVDVAIEVAVIDSVHDTESAARAIVASHRDWWAQEWQVQP